MNNNCELIKDLLPLYLDNVCSESSRRTVEAHLAECEDCSGMLEQLRSSELEQTISEEKNEVISKQAAFFKRKSAVVGTVFAGIMMIPVIVCMIVNLASGAGLTWFFIVLTALITAASLIVVPLVMPENKLLWTIGTFSASLLLLLAVCAIYTKGRWFFTAASAVLLGLSIVLGPVVVNLKPVSKYLDGCKTAAAVGADTLFLILLLAAACAVNNGRWFFVAASSVLFGVSMIFAPVIVNAKPIAKRLGGNKAIAAAGADTLFLALMFLSIAIYNRSSESFFKSVIIALPLLLLVWAFILVIRYLRVNGLVKAGILTALTGSFVFFAETIYSLIAGYGLSFPAFHPGKWDYMTTDGNIKWIVLLGSLLIGLALAVPGILKKRGNENEEV